MVFSQWIVERMFKYLFIICFMLMGSMQVYAYEPQFHRQLSQEAVRQYNSCVPGDKFLSKNSADFVKFSRLEDNVLHNPKRSREWHFFNINSDLGLSEEGARISLNTRFNELRQILDGILENPVLEKFERNRLYKILGRMSHYVQDVSVPANVIPIYHRAGKQDKFEAFPVDIKSQQEYFDRNKDAICVEVKTAPVDDLYPLLESISRRTLMAAEQETFVLLSEKTRQQVPWSLYWTEHKECRSRTKANFKDYGLFGNRFGEEKVVDRCDPDDGPSPFLAYCKSGSCKVDKASFKEFAARRHLAAIVATQKMLYFINMKLKKRQAEDSPTFSIER